MLACGTLQQRPSVEDAPAKKVPKNTVKNYRKSMKKVMKNHVGCRMPVGHHFGLILGSFLGGFGHQNQKKTVILVLNQIPENYESANSKN